MVTKKWLYLKFLILFFQALKFKKLTIFQNACNKLENSKTDQLIEFLTKFNLDCVLVRIKSRDTKVMIVWNFFSKIMPNTKYFVGRLPSATE